MIAPRRPALRPVRQEDLCKGCSLNSVAGMKKGWLLLVAFGCLGCSWLLLLTKAR